MTKDSSRTDKPFRRLARSLGAGTPQFSGRPGPDAPIRRVRSLMYGTLLISLARALLQRTYPAYFDRKMARAALRLRLLVDGVKGHSFFTTNTTGTVTSWNRGAERMFGHKGSAVIGQHLSCFFTTEDLQNGAVAELIQRADHDGRATDRGWQVRKDGTRFFAEGLLTVLGKGRSREFGRQTHDVTERRNQEEALRQTQKLETIGVLASGIAHDFNNLLSGIMTGVTFAMTSLQPDHPSYPSLALAEQAGEKAADLTRQLLAYAGKGKFVVTRFNLSVLIRDMVTLLQASIPKSVELQLALAPDLPWIEADACQIQQIVMNLVINAVESIGPDGGHVRVSTETVPPQKRDGGHTGSEVYMEVQDSGSGMTEATRARIFEPFFTTKITGRGLGLAAVLGIVRAHEGRMQVESSVAKGTTFKIHFPGVEKGVEEEKMPVAVENECSGGTVLVADDEPSLRTMLKAILEHAGYTVQLAGDGREAVEVFQQHPDSFSAILLDMTMPVMRGEEAFRLIRAIRPTVPILVTTGYSEGATRDLFALGAAVEFIQKPYTAARVVARIRAVSQKGEGVEKYRVTNDVPQVQDSYSSL